MSDYDSETYVSSEDEDYMPSDEDDSEDDGKDDNDEEDEGRGGEEEKTQKKKAHKSSKGIPSRKTGQLLLEEREASKKQEVQSTAGLDEASVPIESRNNEEDEKKKADALWASFLTDVGCKTSPPAPAATAALNEKSSQEVAKLGSPEQNQVKKQTEDQPNKPEKVTITKVFDFAGEEVRVTKEVDSSSKEAKCFFKHKDLLQNSQMAPQLAAAEDVKTSSPTSGAKRACGLGNILGKIGGKKQKLSTLEKSKLDWEAFKEQEGIGEELAIFNRGKDGYIERKAFLERVDQREFEHERDVRLSNMKR
ncbi:craniofacial development protein 1 [Protopterus annectens]|uniref:craniofacial development protein 1 n=1 Tax=Protopterus annectens TaxID=7888 RepID=UPI001CFB318F|nr:craniofacial development protein 1 [Protopterus annectens]